MACRRSSLAGSLQPRGTGSRTAASVSLKTQSLEAPISGYIRKIRRRHPSRSSPRIRSDTDAPVRNRRRRQIPIGARNRAAWEVVEDRVHPADRAISRASPMGLKATELSRNNSPQFWRPYPMFSSCMSAHVLTNGRCVETNLARLGSDGAFAVVTTVRSSMEAPARHRIGKVFISRSKAPSLPTIRS